jgi:hypothetical protein
MLLFPAMLYGAATKHECDATSASSIKDDLKHTIPCQASTPSDRCHRKHVLTVYCQGTKHFYHLCWPSAYFPYLEIGSLF